MVVIVNISVILAIILISFLSGLLTCFILTIRAKDKARQDVARDVDNSKD